MYNSSNVSHLTVAYIDVLPAGPSVDIFRVIELLQRHLNKEFTRLGGDSSQPVLDISRGSVVVSFRDEVPRVVTNKHLCCYRQSRENLRYLKKFDDNVFPLGYYRVR